MRPTGRDTVLLWRALLQHSLVHWLPSVSLLSDFHHAQAEVAIKFYSKCFVFLCGILRNSCHRLIVGRMCGGTAVDVEIHPGPYVFLHFTLSLLLISLGQRQGSEYSPRFASMSLCLYLSCFYGFLNIATNAACSKILLQNPSLTSEEIPLAWRCISPESRVSLSRSNISIEVSQALP